MMNLQDVNIGTDLIEIERFQDIEQKQAFLDTTYTAREIEDCKSKRSPLESFAGRFAAKEAIQKSIDEKVRFNMIEIVNDEQGKPVVNFLDEKLKSKYHALVTITHTQSLAQAFCITLRKT